MGASYLHTCDNCGYSVSTSGPWEFFRDAEGARQPYGHPAPMSREAKSRGIFGLSAHVYCPHCDRTFDLVLIEYKKPTSKSLSVWMDKSEPADEYDGKVLKCPKCGNTDLLLDESDGKEVVCPRCNKGKLVSRMEWIS